MATPAFDLEARRRQSVPERLRLVEDLWHGIARDAPDEALPVAPELGVELDRRRAEHEAEIEEGRRRSARRRSRPAADELDR
jgi:putative addiction module component (TIGR02574 family)